MRKKHIISIIAVMAIGAAAYVSADAVAGRGLVTADTVTASETGYAQTVSGDGFLNFTQSNAIEVTVSIAEADIRLVKEGMPAAVTGAAFPDTVLSGSVTSLSSAAHTDAAGRTCVAVTLTLDQTQDFEGELRSGYSAHAVIETEEPRTLLTIPYGVILQDAGGEFVYVLTDGAVRRRDIETGTELPDVTEVTAGLTLEDKVILNPSEAVDNVLGKPE
jgi:HlyD family secretion protein